MVARGDLGVELPPEEVPLAQKRIVRAARLLGKPVVVATQMLESMISAPSPTRAEASDVATAVFDGADAVMLSGETAAGQYPFEAVNMMDRIVARVEQDAGWRAMIDASRAEPERVTADAIAAAARQVCHTIGAKAVVAYTASGATALRVARERPEAPIICLTPHRAIAQTHGGGLGTARDGRGRCPLDGRGNFTGGARGADRRLRPARRRDRGGGRRAVRPFRHHQFAAGRDGQVAEKASMSYTELYQEPKVLTHPVRFAAVPSSTRKRGPSDSVPAFAGMTEGRNFGRYYSRGEERCRAA